MTKKFDWVDVIILMCNAFVIGLVLGGYIL